MKCFTNFAFAIMLALGLTQAANAHFETSLQTLGDGRFNLVISEIASGPAELSISHLRLDNGSDFLLLEGLNGTTIDGSATTFRALPTADLVVEGLPYSGGASVDITDVMFVLPDDLIVRHIEDVNIDEVILTGSHADIFVECPYRVRVDQSFARDVRIGMDYAARNIDMQDSLFARNISVKGRFTNIINVNVGNDVYVYGTAGSDTINLDDVRSRNGVAPFPPIKVSLGSRNDAVSFRNCRASFIDVHGGSGSDVVYNRGGNNFSIGLFNTTSIEAFK